MTMTTELPTATARDVMSRQLLTVEVNETLWDAWQLLFVSGLRHLVVLDSDGHCRGTLNDRSILADVPVTPEHLKTRSVGEVAPRGPVIAARPTDAPRAIAGLMTANAVEAVPVIDDDGRVVGIVTEGDLVRWLAP